MFNILQKKLLCANLSKYKNYSPFKIVCGFTLLDLIIFFLLIDEKIRLDGNRKAQLIRTLLKKARQHVEKKNEKYAFQANKR